MEPCTAVGQDNDSKCLVVKFNRTTWAVDTSFPDITGVLYSIYAYDKDNIWVCGSTGTDYGKQGVLYYWNGTTWASILDDALTALSTSDGDPDTCVVFYGIHGIATDNISICGYVMTLKQYGSGEELYYANGYNAFILDYDGTDFTLGLDAGDDEQRAFAISISPDGYGYCRVGDGTGWSRVYAKEGGAWTSILYWNDSLQSFPLNSIKAFSNTSVITLQNQGASGTHIIYNGSDWTDSISDSWLGGESVDGISVDDVWVTKYTNNTDLATHIVSGSVTSYDGSEWTANLYDVLVIDNNDVWISGEYQESWLSAVLSHWNGTSWSDETVYNVNSLDALYLYSIVEYTVPEPEPEPVPPPLIQRKQIKRAQKAGFKIIYTGDNNLERIQENVKEVFHNYRPIPLGLPTYSVQESALARFGDVVLADPTNGNITIGLQKSTKKEVGQSITVKHTTASGNTVSVTPFFGGAIDGLSNYRIMEGYRAVTFICIDANEWVASKPSN